MKEIISGRSIRLLLTLLFCCLLLSSITALGQSTTEGAVGGTVVDPQDKVIRGADVTVRNNGSNQVFNTKTGESGYFRVGQLQPSTYTVTVNAEGFAPYKAANVIVTVGSLTPVAPHMTIGTTEQVEVTAVTSLVNVTSGDFAPTLNETAIENLPINGGRWSSFVLLTPGVVSDGQGFGLVSFRGMSTLLNNVTIDGADNNQAYFSEERGRTRAGYSTPKVAVQEFQVNTSNYSAEYGRSAGGVINTVTKSGTNGIHGEAFWYVRDNSIGGSTNPFTTLSSFNAITQKVTTAAYKPVDVRKMGGFGVGGPLIKDRLFWFFGFDKYHRNFPGTAVPSGAASFFGVPTAYSAAAFKPGYCGTTVSGTADNNVCQLASLVSRGQSTKDIANVTQAQYDTARTEWMNGMFGNSATGQEGLIGITGRTPRTGDQNIFFPKLDWIINQRNHASFEANRMRWASPAGIQTQATNPYGTNSFGNDYVKDTWGVAKLDTMVTNRVSNQIRFQYGRDFEYQHNQGPSAYEQQTLLQPVNPITGVATGYKNSLGLPPNVYIGSFQWGTPLILNRGAYPDEYKMQIADTVSISLGKHNLKFGLDYVNNSDRISNLYEQYGEFAYSGLPTYFAGLYDTTHKYYTNYYQAFQGASSTNPVQAYKFSTNDWAAFVQDDWKIARRLTINLGMRFDAELLPSAYSNLAQTITVGSKTIKAGALPSNPKNWGPRVGFALDVYGDSKTVLRGGYGMYYGRIINATLFSGMTTTGSIVGQNAYTLKPTNAAAPSFPQVLTDAPPPSGTLSVDYFDPNFKSPQVHEIDLSLQQQIGRNMVLSVSYLGSFGRHMQSFTDVNLAAPGAAYCSTQIAVGKPNAGQPTGSQGGPITNGACAANNTLLASAPSTVTYNVNNQVVTGLPLANGPISGTLPFYTSRLNSGYGGVTDIFSGVNSSYNALVIQLEKHLSNHVQFSANYTWSHALDFGVNGTTNVTGGLSNMIDPLHPKFGMYGNSIYNVPNRFTFNAVLQSPWQHSGWVKYVTDGWQAAPVLQMQNGLGNSVSAASSYPTVYVGTQPYASIAGGMLGAGGSYQIPGTQRNGYRQPSTYVVDLRLSKQFPIRERFKLEFSADAFNLLNHRNVTGVSSTSPYTISNGISGNAPAVGTPATTITNPTLTPYSNSVVSGVSQFNVPSSANSNYVYSTRQIQLGARLTF